MVSVNVAATVEEEVTALSLGAGAVEVTSGCGSELDEESPEDPPPQAARKRVHRNTRLQNRRGVSMRSPAFRLLCPMPESSFYGIKGEEVVMSLCGAANS
jgi:hypothetical protein